MTAQPLLTGWTPKDGVLFLTGAGVGAGSGAGAGLLAGATGRGVCAATCGGDALRFGLRKAMIPTPPARMRSPAAQAQTGVVARCSSGSRPCAGSVDELMRCLIRAA